MSDVPATGEAPETVETAPPALDLTPKVFEAKLLAGIFGATDDVIRTVRVRELVGPDRDVTGEKDVRTSGTRMVTAVLANNVVEVPGIEDLPDPPPYEPRARVAWMRTRKADWKARMKHFAGWPTADRDAVLLALRRYSLGDGVLNQRMHCGELACEHKWREDFNLAEWESEALDRAKWTSKGRPIRWLREVEIDHDGQPLKAVFKLPTGEDEEIIGERASRNVAAIIRLIFERSLVTMNGKPVGRRDLIPVRIQDALWNAVKDDFPGVGIPPTVECERCGADVMTKLSAFGLLFEFGGEAEGG